MVPAAGDAKPAASFFQANFDAMRDSTANQSCGLSMLIDADKELSRWGVDKADGEGWAAFGNATPETKALLESFGCYFTERHEFQGGLVTNHMLSEGGESTTT
ncbi:hypothetical protein H634G_00586 [Metarhizium anisopliae BRIP 53293]|uniref:Uncharacterized protein n=1 Tax=Metarhizium anisopliae BRIP 53293 TaxID=1291518 RepID=A0A0D9PDN3_METAN|nr:hypothetical protein H634G_00586 [Metarhizium anisopliae BRIP 53293]KJK87147.1 hypothetical protein H633G_09000 [Metarhizium anisopliae BRIP 53284]